MGGSSQCTICNLISGLVKINNVNMYVHCLDPNNDSRDRSRDPKGILLSVYRCQRLAYSIKMGGKITRN